MSEAKNVVTKLRQVTRDLLNEQENKSRYISEIILKHNGYCPLCSGDLKNAKEEIRTIDGGRVSAEAAEILATIDRPCGYLTNVLDVELGICPLCGRKEDKKND